MPKSTQRHPLRDPRLKKKGDRTMSQPSIYVALMSAAAVAPTQKKAMRRRTDPLKEFCASQFSADYRVQTVLAWIQRHRDKKTKTYREWERKMYCYDRLNGRCR